MLEINPWAITQSQVVEGQLNMSVLDTKMIIDDNAMFRHPSIAENRQIIESEMGLIPTLEASANQCGIHYHDLEGDGNIGLMINGAGMAMATMDSV